MVRDMDGGQDMFRLLEQSDLIVMNKCDATWYLARGDQSGEHTHTHTLTLTLTLSHTLTHTHTPAPAPEQALQPFQPVIQLWSIWNSGTSVLTFSTCSNLGKMS